MVAAVTINLLRWDTYIPGFVTAAVKMLGQCAIPLGLILVGATLADHLPEFEPRPGARVMAVAILLRLGVLPLLFLILAKYLPASVELKRVLVLQAAMPSGVFPIVMARHYRGDPAIALQVVLATTAVGLLTMPWWIRAGMWFVEIQ